jgi:DNA-binding transcriptional regulator YiaG
LQAGLQEGLQFARGELNLRTTAIPEDPPPLEAQEVLRLRQQLGMSQGVFARILNVSPKTVQSWEQGERRPTQAALRLLQILGARPEVVSQVVGIRCALVRLLPFLSGVAKKEPSWCNEGRAAAFIDTKEAPMSTIATSSRRCTASRPRRRPLSPHQSQIRRTRRLDRKRRRRQTHQARTARRKLRHLHQALPQPARSLFDSLAGAFTRPTFLRFVVLALATILTIGGRTICHLLRTLGALAPGHPSSYHRVFCKRRWSSWRLARGLAGWVFDYLVPSGRIFLAGDDTVDEHPGDHVFGKACHRDPVRSTHSFTAFRWGHKWVVLTVLVRFPFTRRQWALPLLVALYRSEKDNKKAGRRHKTPARLLRQLCCVLLRWFRQRQFVLTGDNNYGSHEMARFASRRRGRLHLVSKFYPDANLFEPPPPYSGHGRPRVKGKELAKPEQVVADARRTKLNVAWYGGGRRDVEVVTGTGHWYKAGQGLVEVRWVFVHDLTGTHRDEYFMTTNVAMTALEVIETYVGRWNEETTFQEMRLYLGLETTRGWKEKTVLRMAPCLFGLYTVVAALYSQLPRRYARVRAVEWAGKIDVTFSDAITAVRRWLWLEWVFAIPGYRPVFEKLARPFRSLLLHALAPTA